MNITKVKLKGGGDNGADIVYIGEGEIHSSELTAPVHGKLIKAMDQYKSHLLRVCSYPQAKKVEEDIALLDNLTMISVKCNGLRVQLAGRLIVLNGNKKINLVSCEIEEEDYEMFSELLDIFDDVSKEGYKYMEENSETKGRQFRIKFGETIEEPNTEIEAVTEEIVETEPEMNIVEKAVANQKQKKRKKKEEKPQEVEVIEEEEELEGF